MTMQHAAMPENWHPCPQCGTESPIVLDIDSHLPVLSASHTPVYHCPRHGLFWSGMNESQEKNKRKED